MLRYLYDRGEHEEAFVADRREISVLSISVLSELESDCHGRRPDHGQHQ